MSAKTLGRATTSYIRHNKVKNLAMTFEAYWRGEHLQERNASSISQWKMFALCAKRYITFSNHHIISRKFPLGKIRENQHEEKL